MSMPRNSQLPSLNVVIVEDDPELRDILASGLRYFGHTVHAVSDGKALDAEMAVFPPDIVILDLGLPEEDGIDIAARLRSNCGCGIVMITARGKLYERVTGLEAGADLYFVKPVDIRELDAALRSLARRISLISRPLWRFEPLTSKLTTPSGVEIRLTAHECILMRKLLERPGENVPRREIFSALRQPDDLYADKRLETMISRLRAKVRAADPDTELPVRARHNLGYAFLAELKQDLIND
ncbi:transcriptional regulatory protein PhoP [Geobacter sp. OR-1]|uniref:response regulator transcription factor n=1 Tax=Geobacter sp. OR-1 TaxID=1266765 RepID=UPI000541C86F|nr:response regulator transcription factor [Geobacter sp. OR-1]GAM10099.1 transcriptional regulatory protein PhoP [Geobacter sp. OR-1]